MNPKEATKMATSYCNKCAEPIKWVQQKEGWRPMNSNDTPHFKTCVPNPNAAAILKIVKEGKRERLQIGENEYI